jgi:hypothetical protein
MSQADPNQVLEALSKELQDCQTECNQAQSFITQILNRLNSSQELINHYKLSAQASGDRITALEQELKLKSQQLETTNFEHDELRRRIKSEQHNASQFKAALNRCLNTSQFSEEETKAIFTEAHLLTTNSSDSLLTSRSELKNSNPSYFGSGKSSNLKSANSPDSEAFAKPPHKQESKQEFKPEVKSETKQGIKSEVSEDRPRPTIKLPQFAPLKPR